MGRQERGEGAPAQKDEESFTAPRITISHVLAPRQRRPAGSAWYCTVNQVCAGHPDIAEPHLYADRTTGQVHCGSHNRWRSLTPTTEREHGPGHFAYRAMLWVNTATQAVQIPVHSHDVARAMITTWDETVLVIAAYDPNEGDNRTERHKAIDQKLMYVRQAIDEAQSRRVEDIEILICSDFNPHHSLCGGQA